MSFAKEQLIRDIETFSEAKIEQVAIFINALKTQSEAATLEAKFAEENRQLADLAAQYDPRARLTLDELLAQVTDENRHE